MTTEELRKLRDEKVFAALSKRPKPKRKRKPGPRPQNAKAPPVPIVVKTDDKPPKKK